MLKKLQSKLAIICTSMAGVVVLGLMLFGFYYMRTQYIEMNHLIAQNAMMTVISKLQTETMIRTDWLAQSEMVQKSIIHIESGGQPIFFSGAWQPVTDRTQLLDQARKTALKMGLDLDAPIVDSSESQQIFFEIKGNEREQYYCGVVKISADRTWRSLIYLQDQRRVADYLNRQKLLYFAVAAVTLAALALLSRWFSGIVIRPICENMKSQQDFIAAASHEMRSPLTVIDTSLETIRAKPEHTQRLLGIIESESRLLSKLVSDLLTLASVSSENWVLNREPLEPDTLLMECVEELEAFAAANGYTLVINLPDQILPLVSGDRTRLKQTIAVLIHNAISHAHGGERITVKGYSDLKTVYIEVIDHGAGIPDHLKTQVFERFFQAEPSHSDKQHFGLGLAIAAEMARLHHGTIILADTEGGGCTARLSFPSLRAH